MCLQLCALFSVDMVICAVSWLQIIEVNAPFQLSMVFTHYSIVIYFIVSLELHMRVRYRFPAYVRNFLKNMYADGEYPKWVVDALAAVNLHV